MFESDQNAGDRQERRKLLIGLTAIAGFVIILLIAIFSVQLGWFPSFGSGHEGVDRFVHLVLPACVLGTVPMAVVARMTRSSMLEVLSQDYVRAARARGYSPARVAIVHALRNALLPVVTAGCEARPVPAEFTISAA